ncbi:hypothetical protein A0U90_13975 (plasmid) [Kozakia baliensis]|nr:hypothetical protein A0U90_13975 [Kozakia baliensis]
MSDISKTLSSLMPVTRAGRRDGVKAARHAPALEPRASRAAGEHGEAPPLTLARRSAATFFRFPSLLFFFRSRCKRPVLTCLKAAYASYRS